MLMASSHTKSIKELSVKLEQKDSEIQTKFEQKNSEIQELQEELKILKLKIDELEQHSKQMDIKSKSESEVAAFPISSGIIQIGFRFHVNDFESRKKRNESAVHKLYLGRTGYYVKLMVYPNGRGKAKNSFLSIFFRIIHGQNDDHLIWPFRGAITIGIGHLTATIESEDFPDECFVRPSTRKEEYNQEWGIEMFMSHSDIRGFINNDVLLVKVIDATVPLF